jgi:hypothetical protein
MKQKLEVMRAQKKAAEAKHETDSEVQRREAQKVDACGVLHSDTQLRVLAQGTGRGEAAGGVEGARVRSGSCTSRTGGQVCVISRLFFLPFLSPAF